MSGACLQQGLHAWCSINRNGQELDLVTPVQESEAIYSPAIVRIGNHGSFWRGQPQKFHGRHRDIRIRTVEVLGGAKLHFQKIAMAHLAVDLWTMSDN